MSDWILVLFTIASLLVLLAGVFNFPYVPMLLGVYSSAGNAFRGKLILKLLKIYPVVTLVSIYLSWSSNTYYAFVPFVYILFLWIIRDNKVDSSGPSRQYTSLQHNLDARLKELEYRWKSWLEIESKNLYISFRFFAPDESAVNALKNIFMKNESLYGDIETNTYDNGVFSVYVYIKIDSIDKQSISTIIKRMLDIAWANNSELLSLDVMEGVNGNA